MKCNKTTFKFIKLDYDTKKPIKGVKYFLTNGKEKYYATSDEKGEVIFRNIEPDEYVLREIEAPINYKLENKDVYLYIDRHGNIYHGIDKLLLFNKKKRRTTTLNLKKIDKFCHPLENAVFRLADHDFEMVKKTNRHGEIKFQLPIPGRYILKEIEAPKGYKENHEIYKIEANEKGEIFINGRKENHLEVVNHKDEKMFEFFLILALLLFILLLLILIIILLLF